MLDIDNFVLLLEEIWSLVTAMLLLGMKTQDQIIESISGWIWSQSVCNLIPMMQMANVDSKGRKTSTEIAVCNALDFSGISECISVRLIATCGGDSGLLLNNFLGVIPSGVWMTMWWWGSNLAYCVQTLCSCPLSYHSSPHIVFYWKVQFSPKLHFCVRSGQKGHT